MKTRTAISIITGGMAALFLSGCGPGKEVEPEVEVLCAAGLRLPVEEAARAYEAAGRGNIRLQFGPSQALLSGLEISKKGDLFLPGDRSYNELAKEKGLVDKEVPLTTMTAVVAVKKGNPKHILSLADLTRDDVRLVLLNRELAAVSQLASRKLGPEMWARLVERALAIKVTVSDAANDILLEAADVSIIWDVTVFQSPGLQRVDVPELGGVQSNVSGSVTTSSARSAGALKFLQWLAVRETGGKFWTKFGYTPTSGSDRQTPGQP